MTLFLYHLEVCLPLFLLVLLGWLLIKCKLFNTETSRALGSFTFRLLMPVLLFKLMSNISELPAIDYRAIGVFATSCVIVFFLGRLLGRSFGLDNTGKTVFGMAAIFGNNVQLGVPIVQVSLGDGAIPTLSLIVIFSVLTMWTTAIVFVEFGKPGSTQDMKKVFVSMTRVFKNPIVFAILLGSAFSFTGLKLPQFLDQSISLVAHATTPVALIVVGMGLAQHKFTAGLPKGLGISALKIVVQPLLVFLLARAIDLPDLETYAVTLTAALPVAINIYMMATDFRSEEGASSNAIFVSTLLSAVAIPITLTLMGVGV